MKPWSNVRAGAALVILWGAILQGQTATPVPTHTLTLLDAVQAALLRNPTLQVQQAQVEVSQGQRLQASALFDTLIQAGLSQNRVFTPLPSAVQTAYVLPNEVTNTTLLSSGVSKLFRNGIAINSSLSDERLLDSYSTPQGLNASGVSLSVTLPLLRGRGRDVVAAQEYVATVEVQAALLDVNQVISQLMLQTVSDYWTVEAAQQSLAIARGAENRGEKYVENVRALIQADHVPPADLNEVEANLADRVAMRIAAEQSLLGARGQLAIDIGTKAVDMVNPPNISESFPDASALPVPADDAGSLQFYISQALLHRPDVLAQQKRVQEAGILKVAAANARLPLLNANLGTGYVLSSESRQVSHYLESFVNGVPAGPSAIASITFSFPPANDQARGQFQQANAVLHQSELRSVDLERTIASNLTVAAENIRNAVARVEKARESIRAFRASLYGEQEKYRAGFGSVVAILTVEDRLNNALQNEVIADQTYATSIVQFRYLTGTLVDATSSTQDVERQLFYTLPYYGQSPAGATP